MNSPPPDSELDQRVKQLARLIDVSKSVAAQLDLEPLLQQVVDSATHLLDANMGGLLVLDEQGTGIEYFKVTGWPYELSGTPGGIGILSLPYREKINLRSNNIVYIHNLLAFLRITLLLNHFWQYPFK